MKPLDRGQLPNQPENFVSGRIGLSNVDHAQPWGKLCANYTSVRRASSAGCDSSGAARAALPPTGWVQTGQQTARAVRPRAGAVCAVFSGR